MKKNNHLRLRSLRVRALVVALCLLAASLCLNASNSRHEKEYALIAGTVWAPNDYPLPGVKVKIRPANQKDQRKAKWEMVSNERGEFMQRVPPGPADYIVWCERVRPKHGPELEAPAVTVHVYDVERQDTGLHLEPQPPPAAK